VLRIRDPVPFRPLDLGSGMGKKTGSESGMNNPDHISESLETMRIRDPGWKKFGSWIIIPDPQFTVKNTIWTTHQAGD
jgi:hypothetical protein